jgi:peroxiredoxin
MRWSSKRFTMGLRWLVALTLSIVAWGLIASAGLPQRADYTGVEIAGLGYAAPEIGAFAPPFTTTLLDGTTLNTRAETGKWIVLNFWATWCIPCEVEMPILDALAQALDPRTTRIVAINVGESKTQVTRWLAERDLTLPVALDETLAITNAYQLRGQPTTFIVAPDGTISHIIFGAATEDQLRAALNHR